MLLEDRLDNEKKIVLADGTSSKASVWIARDEVGKLGMQTLPDTEAHLADADGRGTVVLVVEQE